MLITAIVSRYIAKLCMTCRLCRSKRPLPLARSTIVRRRCVRCSLSSIRAYLVHNIQHLRSSSTYCVRMLSSSAYYCIASICCDCSMTSVRPSVLPSIQYPFLFCICPTAGAVVHETVQYQLFFTFLRVRHPTAMHHSSNRCFAVTVVSLYSKRF